jgi:hypothetical protein
LTVTFSAPVAFANNDPAATFNLTRLTGTGGTVGLAAVAFTNAFGRTAVALTFTGTANIDPTSVLNGGQASLADGRYHLSFADGAVTDAALGWAIDGDGNGVPAGGYNSADDTAGSGAGYHSGLFRLFGDATGDGAVDPVDLAALRTAFNATAGGPDYLDYFDADHSGGVDLIDLGQFRTRFNVTVFLP